jgi:hypothetical protein
LTTWHSRAFRAPCKKERASERAIRKAGDWSGYTIRAGMTGGNISRLKKLSADWTIANRPRNN